jgi:decaprenylphospho-beta-D-erythro-pentofuranosid-2-ulose 2-reductase
MNIETSQPRPRSTALIIGATSSLAQSICHELARQGYALTLTGRDEGELDLLRSDILTRYRTPCTTLVSDFLDPDFSPETLIAQAGDFDHMLLAVGDMGSGEQTDLLNIAYTIHLNYTLPAQIATAAALHLADKKNGTITLISSVAGDRGRQSNYAYGSAKAALTTFASGLRNSVYKQKIHVMTVKPGFLDTPMTWGMNSPLIASREHAAEQIVAALKKRKNVIYVPGFWRWIMLLIMHIPETIFKRLSL